MEEPVSLIRVTNCSATLTHLPVGSCGITTSPGWTGSSRLIFERHQAECQSTCPQARNLSSSEGDAHTIWHFMYSPRAAWYSRDDRLLLVVAVVNR